MQIVAIGDQQRFLPDIPACDLVDVGGDVCLGRFGPFTGSRRGRDSAWRLIASRQAPAGTSRRLVLSVRRPITGGNVRVVEDDRIPLTPWGYIRDRLRAGSRHWALPRVPTSEPRKSSEASLGIRLRSFHTSLDSRHTYPHGMVPTSLPAPQHLESSLHIGSLRPLRPFQPKRPSGPHTCSVC
jgi:hypothetical protein